MVGVHGGTHVGRIIIFQRRNGGGQKNRTATFGLRRSANLEDIRPVIFKAVTAVRNRAVSYANSVSLPYPEPGVRLIRQDRIDRFDLQMREFRDELDEAVGKLDDHYAELRQAARDRLGTLYDPSDYPDSLVGMFSVEWEFPAVEPPDYLRQLNPQLYEQECQRVQARFDDAVRLAEETFLGELAKIVSHLTERLSGQVDGQPKIFRDSAVGNTPGHIVGPG